MWILYGVSSGYTTNCISITQIILVYGAPHTADTTWKATEIVTNWIGCSKTKITHEIVPLAVAYSVFSLEFFSKSHKSACNF